MLYWVLLIAWVAAVVVHSLKLTNTPEIRVQAGQLAVAIATAVSHTSRNYR